MNDTRRSNVGLAVAALVLGGLAAAIVALLRAGPGASLTTGGKLRPALAAYDVRRYDLAFTVLPEERRLEGRNTVTVSAREASPRVELDLVDRFTVASATVDGSAASFTHRGGRLEVTLPQAWQPGEHHVVEIVYAGAPRRAPQAPWNGGFVWAHSRDGQPWVAVTVQGEGADEWWPVKDHPGDEPDEGVSIELTVPKGLVGLATGRRVSERQDGDTVTTRWETSYPVNNYSLSIAVGPYRAVEEVYHGVDGSLAQPIVFWSLPESLEKARVMWRQAPRMLEVLGRRFGEYPFLGDKFAVAQSPHLGMEHQTLVAYGARFRDNEYGFDWLLLHETAHEWWGNALSVDDWSDYWIHEGFAAYSEAVFVNDTLGLERYLDYMRGERRGIENQVPIIQGRDLDGTEAYTGDIYNKGACVLHSLRWLLGDETFFALLHRFATDPRYQYKLTSSAAFEAMASEAAGRDLSWFFDRLLRQASLPRWTIERRPQGADQRVVLRWLDPGFELPLEVRTPAGLQRIEMAGGVGELTVPADSWVLVDPRSWALAEGEVF